MYIGHYYVYTNDIIDLLMKSEYQTELSPVCLSWLKNLDLVAAVVAELAVGLPNQYSEGK